MGDKTTAAFGGTMSNFGVTKSVSLEDLIEDKVIVLRAVYKITEAIVFPAMDSNKWFHGVLRRPINDTSDWYIEKPELTSTLLKEGKRFDLNNLAEAITWNWVKQLTTVTGSFNEAQMSPAAMFYVEEPGMLDRIKITKGELKSEAYVLISGEASSNYISRALIIGEDFTGSPSSAAHAYLLDLADSNPEKIIKSYKLKDISLRLTVLGAIRKGIITKESGIFFFGEEVLGRSVDSVVGLLKQVDMSNIKKAITRSLGDEDNSELHESDETIETRALLEEGKTIISKKEQDLVDRENRLMALEERLTAKLETGAAESKIDASVTEPKVGAPVVKKQTNQKQTRTRKVVTETEE